MLNVELQRLTTLVPRVVVAGLANVSRAVIAIDDAYGAPRYKICVEGSGSIDVMATYNLTYGVIGKLTKSNSIWEVNSTWCDTFFNNGIDVCF